MMSPEAKAAAEQAEREHIARIVAAAPRATEAKRQRIAALLAAGRHHQESA